MSNVNEILSLMRSNNEKDVDIVMRACKTAKSLYKDRNRFNGEPYFTHVYETAKKLAELGMDAQTVAAGFLHDAIEDELISEEDVEKKFGQEILFLIKGVTKLGKLRYKGLERHAESLRKLFIATAQDIRVLIIRLADRLHNVKTLDGHKSEEKRKRIAVETLTIFAPLANRLGMGQLKGELEDYAFKYAKPEEYQKVKELLKQKTKLRQKYLEKVHRNLQKELAKEKIKCVKTDYRVKHLYSLYRKLLWKDMDIEKVYDIVALRVVVQNVADCYRVLGIVHKMWKPLPGRIKDYIATPKLNGYQSLHTTIFTGDGGIVEIQIRTKDMHEEAEYGVVSHLSYKEHDPKNKIGTAKDLPWIKQLLEWQKEVSESDEFLKNLETDFFNDRVFVFTPKGDVIDLPDGASPIDFAYAVHTDIGNHMSGAKVNGKLVSLDTKLKRGDIIDISTKKDITPTNKWLAYTKTTLAKRSIKSILQKQNTKGKSFLPYINRRHLF